MYEIRLAESGALAVYHEGQQEFSSCEGEILTRHCLKVSSLREAQSRIPTLYSSDHYPVGSWLKCLKAAIEKVQAQGLPTPIKVEEPVCPVVERTKPLTKKPGRPVVSREPSLKFKGTSGFL